MKRSIFACLFVLACAIVSRAAVLGIEDARVIVPHWTYGSNVAPMTEATAAQQWEFVHELFYRTSYHQFDHSTTVYPAFAVDPPLKTDKFGVTSPTCIGYDQKAIATAVSLGFDIPPGAKIIIVQNECGHQGNTGVYRRPDGGTNYFVYGQKGNEIAFYYQAQHGITGGFAWVCSESGCVSTWRRDPYDNAANGDHHSYNAAHRLQMGWISAAAGDMQSVQAVISQYTIRSLDADRDGQLKYLRIVSPAGTFTVEVRTDPVVTSVPRVVISRLGQPIDTSSASTCMQFYLPLGATWKPLNATFGIRLDALVNGTATVSVVENATNNVPSQCSTGSK